MTQMIPFQFDQQQVRVVQADDGNTLFVARDVAEALGYARPTKAVQDHCKGVLKRDIVTPTRGEQTFSVIREADLYRLIVKSQLPSAERFEVWVFEEVLPAIRKTGGYQVESPAPESDPETSSKFFKACYEVGSLVRRGDHNQAVLAANMATRSKFGIDFLGEMGMDALPAPEGERELLTPSDIGIELGGISGQAVNKSLERLGFQQQIYSAKGKKEWRATDEGFRAGAKLLDTGKKQGSGTPIRQLKWEAGVVNLLKEAGCGFAG